MKTVIEIAGAGFCSGCGVCAGICEPEAISMEINKFGEFVPKLDENLCTECGLCLKVCPFSEKVINEDILGKELFGNKENILHQDSIGYFRNTYVGHSTNDAIRLNSASGGIATQLLNSLLKNKAVDYAVCVLPNKAEFPEIFAYQFVEHVDDIVNNAKSVYFPVEASRVIRKIISLRQAKIAFIGLPCTIKGMRNAIKLLPTKFTGKEIIFIGLTCGGMRSAAYSEYLLMKHTKDPVEITSINFREKKIGGRSSDKGYKFNYWNNENEHASITLWDHKNYWYEEYFKLNSCSFCDDIFAELADISLMDAWLPEYYSDWKGNNLIITRSQYFDDYILNLQANKKILIENIDYDKVILAEKGLIKIKKDGLQYRLYKIKNKDYWKPPKRVRPKKIGSLKDQIHWDYTDHVRKTTRNLWAKEKSVEVLDKKILNLKTRMKYIKRHKKFLIRIKRSLNRISEHFYKNRKNSNL